MHVESAQLNAYLGNNKQLAQGEILEFDNRAY